jgi:predicted RNase H-like nuclease
MKPIPFTLQDVVARDVQSGFMRLVCGVDGRKGGWVVITEDLDSKLISWRSCDTAHELIYHEPKPEIIAIDIPIGLLEHGWRECDLEARRLLGPGRASSVFKAPIRPTLTAVSYKEACTISTQIEKKKISIQTWAIIHKIIDIDAALRQDFQLQTRLREVHPEICFCFLAEKQPLRYSKKNKLGYKERYALLEPVFGHWLQAALAEQRQLDCAKDDILDSFAALWTAKRIARGISQTIPSSPPSDFLGLCMEIVV